VQILVIREKNLAQLISNYQTISTHRRHVNYEPHHPSIHREPTTNGSTAASKPAKQPINVETVRAASTMQLIFIFYEKL
jgi:hypothetical protein